jgi:DNA transformation protein and related proteins
MTVSPSFRTFVLEQLGRTVQRLRARSMFGGVGIYAGEVFFALIADDTLYLKVDDTTRGDFEARGLGPFRPYGDNRETMQYYRVSEDLLEEPDELGAWAQRAISVARRAKARASRRGSA